MPPKKKARTLTEATEEGNPRPRLAGPRPMRMEVLICAPNFQPKRTFAPVEKLNKAKNQGSPPKTLKRKRVVERGKATANDDETVPLRKKRKKKSSESDVKKVPRERRSRKAWSHHSDESCSGDEVETEHIIESRLRTREPKREQAVALAWLKHRKKQGLPLELKPQSESEKSEESESERNSLFDSSSSESDRSSDFIVDDDGTAVASLPKEFSMDTHTGLSDQFKKVFQFMVHLAVRPPIERQEFMKGMLKSEEYFSIPFNVARRRISSLAVSLIASRWKPSFIALLRKYPVLDINDLPAARVAPKCDACRIKGRRACRLGELSGIPYNPLGFADATDSDKDASSDKDSDSEESSGAVAKKNIKKFGLGRFCSERVQVFHQISHWEYELFNCILQEVDQLHEAKISSGIVNDRDVYVPVKYVDGKRPQNLDDADSIYEWLLERSIVDMEWDKVKSLIVNARNVETATKTD
ncbi:hypothetical protein DFH06DRAFT_35238 [Mycena polygramma]|nr:hypothetical protein DFH06DRAFT_35238 [Mycena polygramma]